MPETCRAMLCPPQLTAMPACAWLWLSMLAWHAAVLHGPHLGDGEGMAQMQQAVHVGVGEVAKELARVSLACEFG